MPPATSPTYAAPIDTDAYDMLILCITPKTSVKPIPIREYVVPNRIPSTTACRKSNMTREGRGYSAAPFSTGPLGRSLERVVQHLPVATFRVHEHVGLVGFAVRGSLVGAEQPFRGLQRRKAVANLAPV